MKRKSSKISLEEAIAEEKKFLTKEDLQTLKFLRKKGSLPKLPLISD